MIHQIHVYSYIEMQDRLKTLYPDAKIIGCVDKGGLVKTPLFETDDDKLCLIFDDCTPDTKCFNMTLYPMEKAQAIEVIRFIERLNQGRIRYDLHVHCIGGQARSTAIASFAAWIVGLDKKYIKTNNPFRPNQHVSKLLFDTYNERMRNGILQ